MLGMVTRVGRAWPSSGPRHLVGPYRTTVLGRRPQPCRLLDRDVPFTRSFCDWSASAGVGGGCGESWTPAIRAAAPATPTNAIASVAKPDADRRSRLTLPPRPPSTMLWPREAYAARPPA
jgi:hypothetical protein